MIKENPPYEISWPVGLRVWVAWDNEWREGLIESRPSPVLAMVRLERGDLVKTGFRFGLIYRDFPRGKEVPKSRCTNGSTGLRTKLFEIDPATGRLLKRKEGVWSNRHDACIDCSTTEKPHEARGRCHTCYQNWRYDTNFNGTAVKSKRRAKAYRIRTDYDAIHHERVKNDPKRKAIHKKAALKWARKHAKWPIGSAVATSIDNFTYRDAELVVAKAPGSSRMTYRGQILSTNNGSALVQFKTWTIRVPFSRLQLVSAMEVAS